MVTSSISLVPSFSQHIFSVNSLPCTVPLLLSFEARGQEERVPLNVCLVIDRSGSMSGDSLRYALRAAISFIEGLSLGDTFSVVVYDDDVDTIVPPMVLTSWTNRDAAIASIKRVQSGGITNLSGGWSRGYELVKKKTWIGSLVNRVILLTDGLANTGITGTNNLIPLATKFAKEGVATTTVGFGSGFNEDLLVGIARASGGNFYFVANADEAESIYRLELASLTSLAVRDFSVSLHPLSTVTINHVVGMAEGDISSQEPKLLGVYLDVPTIPTLGEYPVLDVVYTYRPPKDDHPIVTRQTIRLKIGTDEESAVSGNSATVLALAHLRIAASKQLAISLQESDRSGEAERILLDCIDDLLRDGLNEHFSIAEEIEHMRYFASRIARRMLDSYTRKEMTDQSYQGLSRSTRSDLLTRGSSSGDDIRSLQVVQHVAPTSVELVCVREGGRLRMRVISDGYNPTLNVQFPRAIRAEGVHYVVDSVELSQDCSFYRAVGNIYRLVPQGSYDPYSSSYTRSTPSTYRAASTSAVAAALPTTSDRHKGVLVQCVRDGSKLRVRAVEDGYNHQWNMRFPRAPRQEGTQYVVEHLQVGPDKKSYIACGSIYRFVQPAV